MAILLNPDGTKVVLDCNITTNNSTDVLAYVKRVLGKPRASAKYFFSYTLEVVRISWA